MTERLTTDLDVLTALRALRDCKEAKRLAVTRCDKGHSMEAVFDVRGKTIVMLYAIHEAPALAALNGRPARVPARAYVGRAPDDEPVGCRCGHAPEHTRRLNDRIAP